MNNEKITQIKGRLFDGSKPLAIAAVLASNGRKTQLIYNNTRQTYHCDELRVSPRSGQSDRFIALPDGGQFQTGDHDFLDTLPHEVRSEGPVAWLEARMGIAVIGVFLIAVTLALGYFYGLPVVADKVVEKIPMATEQALSEQVLAWFEDKKWLTPTEQEEERRSVLRDSFNLLHQGLVSSAYITLEFRSSKMIGPNAFALPGGTIVITDQLIPLASSDEEILAVLAHEIGHVELRHSLRQVLQSSVVGLIAATVTGDAATLSAAVAGLPAVLAQSSYSRKFESEADDFALDLLKNHGISPSSFADIMEKLDTTEIGEVFSYISTHPITSERIAKARNAGESP